MKTFILAIFGLLALANAEEEFSIDQSEARKANPQPTKGHSDIKLEKPEKYVQLFSWSVVASILNCYYRIFAKKRNRKDPSKLKIMHQNCEKKFTKILLCLFSS